ncbi:MAG: TetR/AcrR family transcriptional regulator [Hydrococcus sp. C42_A2020_068]|uniref:TetR/AcrR family transcriptional regulator n=1 Tax=Pleurocapsa sp. PCC 7327 TaxID=118163 RepID=UPI00029F821C|nr:TetR/AcrR family transcriptional regulator [Pleurocapsa sp. PCC 7327]AFY78507.1 transcriptional regulator [Pleurocapsa sp. PCC 7327]MBF2022295.1 TetR/AcrR family transcriptional regulator [Hydrococcus sp. C42_A2020_068]
MPKIVDHDLYRKELLAKSFDLFAEKGYGTITMRKIAEGLGVSTGTLYHYFPSKQALFEQLVEELVEGDILRVTAELKDARTLEERIEKSFDFISRNQDYFFKQTLIFADFYKQQQQQGRELSDALRQSCMRVAKSMSKLLGIEDPELITFLLSLVDGLIWRQIYGYGCVDYSAQAKVLTKMLTAYLNNNNKLRK